MRGLSFLPLGVGDAFSARFYSTCLAVESEGTWLLIDCPHPIRKMLSEAAAAASIELDLGDIHAVVLTHLHADHSSGLEGFLYFNFFALRRKGVIVTHPDVSARLWDNHLAGGMDSMMGAPGKANEPRTLTDYATLVDLSVEEAIDFGPFSIEARMTIHPVPTTALRIRAGGRCLGYSADTTFDPSLIAWLAEADLIVHETNLGIHTRYDDLLTLPAELKARLRVVHFPDFFDVEGSEIATLRQGVRVEV